MCSPRRKVRPGHLAIAAVALLGSATPARSQEAKKRFELAPLPAWLLVQQRETVKLPGSFEALELRLTDITGGLLGVNYFCASRCLSDGCYPRHHQESHPARCQWRVVSHPRVGDVMIAELRIGRPGRRVGLCWEAT
jgi:hypothetical protein